MIIKTEQLLYNYTTFKNPSLNPEPFSVHCHNSYEFIFFEKGNANYIIDEKKYKLHKNDLIFIRPYKYHHIEFTSDTEYSRVNIAFTDKIVNKGLLNAIPDTLEIINCPPESMLGNLFGRMNYYASKLNHDGFTEILTAMLTEILYSLMLTDIDTINIPSTLTPILVEVIQYVNENLFNIKEIKAVSARFNISEQYLFRLFKQQLCISPHKYITIKRLLHAQALLQQGKKPMDIYHNCGFESYVSFYKQYIKMFGYSPSKERSPL